MFIRQQDVSNALAKGNIMNLRLVLTEQVSKPLCKNKIILFDKGRDLGENDPLRKETSRIANSFHP